MFTKAPFVLLETLLNIFELRPSFGSVQNGAQRQVKRVRWFSVDLTISALEH